MRKTKRIAKTMMLLAMTFAVSMSVYAEEAEGTGETEQVEGSENGEGEEIETIPYEYETITVLDAETQEEIEEIVITRYIGEEESVIIPDTIEGKPVVKLDGAFNGNTKVKEVTLNASLKSVGETPFLECSALEKIIVDEGNEVYEADEYGVLYQKYIGEDVSEYDNLPADPEAITYHLVRWPMALPMNRLGISGYYPLKENVTKINAYAIHKVNMDGHGVKIPAPAYVIEDHAFEDCSNLSQGLVFAEGCKTVWIGNYAFAGNETIHEITLPKTVKTVGAYCFKDCTNLDTVHFSEGLLNIMEGAFYGCRTLHTIQVPEGITSIENETFNGCGNLGTVILPDSLTSIGDNAFKDCVTIHEMVIPKQVTYISNSSFQGVDLNKLDFSKNTAMAIKLGLKKPESVKPAVLTTKSLILKRGKKATIKVKKNGDTIRDYILSKASRKRISVNAKGVVTAKKKAKAGMATVTVRLKSGRQFIVKVYVTKLTPKKVSKKKTYSLKKKKTLQLMYGTDPLSVKYSVPKQYKKYVSVNKYGIVKAKKYTKKKVVIKVKSNGKTIKQKIKIKK